MSDRKSRFPITSLRSLLDRTGFQSMISQSRNFNASLTPIAGAKRQLFILPLTTANTSTSGEVSVTQSFPFTTTPPRRQPLSRLALVFDRRKESNRVNAQLSCMFYMINLVNSFRSRELEKTIEEQKQQTLYMNHKVHKLKDEILTLNTSVDDLSSQLIAQRELSNQLCLSLKSQREVLSRTLVESRAEMEKQCYIIDQQQKMVQKLIQEKVKHDLVVDSSVLLISVYLSYSVLLGYPLRAVLWIIPHRTSRIWSKQVLRLAFIIKVFMILKRLSVKGGVRNSVGSLVSYAQIMTTHLQTSRFVQCLLAIRK